MYQMTKWNHVTTWKGSLVVKNLQRIFSLLPSTLQSFIVSFSSLFICPDHNFTVLVHSYRSHNIVFSRSSQLFSATKLSQSVSLSLHSSLVSCSRCLLVAVLHPSPRGPQTFPPFPINWLPRPPAHLPPLPSSATLHIYRSSSFVPVSVCLRCHVPSCVFALDFLSPHTCLPACLYVTSWLSTCCPVCHQLFVYLPACLHTCTSLFACKPPIKNNIELLLCLFSTALGSSPAIPETVTKALKTHSTLHAQHQTQTDIVRD